MKFTKEQAIEDLNRKLAKEVGEPCLSSKTILNKVERTFAKLEKKSDEETELNDFIEDVFPDILDMDKNLRKLNSDKISSYEQEFKEQWEKDHPSQNPDKDADDGKGELSKAVLDRLKKLEEKDAMYEAEKTKTEKRSELLKKLKEKKVDDTEWLNAYVKKLSINGDTDIDAEVNDALTLYNRSNSHFDNNVTPQGVGGRVKEDEHRDDDVKNLLKRNRGINE